MKQKLKQNILSMFHYLVHVADVELFTDVLTSSPARTVIIHIQVQPKRLEAR